MITLKDDVAVLEKYEKTGASGWSNVINEYMFHGSEAKANQIDFVQDF